MIRITIDWDFISPALQTVSGIVTLDYRDDSQFTLNDILIIKFRVTVEPGSVGYKAIDDKGIPSIALEAVKPQLDVMVRSYQQGVIMDKRDCSWVINDDVTTALEHLDKIPEYMSNYISDKIYKTEISTPEGIK